MTGAPVGKFVPGCRILMKELAQRLAPGRKVRRFTVDCPANGVVTATVEVYIEPEDIERSTPSNRML